MSEFIANSYKNIANLFKYDEYTKNDYFGANKIRNLSEG